MSRWLPTTCASELSFESGFTEDSQSSDAKDLKPLNGWKCPMCDTKFDSSPDLVEHVHKTHSDSKCEGGMTCPFCKKQFPSYTQLGWLSFFLKWLVLPMWFGKGQLWCFASNCLLLLVCAGSYHSCWKLSALVCLLELSTLWPYGSLKSYPLFGYVIQMITLQSCMVMDLTAVKAVTMYSRDRPCSGGISNIVQHIRNIRMTWSKQLWRKRKRAKKVWTR